MTQNQRNDSTNKTTTMAMMTFVKSILYKLYTKVCTICTRYVYAIMYLGALCRRTDRSSKHKRLKKSFVKQPPPPPFMFCLYRPYLIEKNTYVLRIYMYILHIYYILPSNAPVLTLVANKWYLLRRKTPESCIKLKTYAIFLT